MKSFVGEGPFCKRVSSPTPPPPKTFIGVRLSTRLISGSGAGILETAPFSQHATCIHRNFEHGRLSSRPPQRRKLFARLRKRASSCYRARQIQQKRRAAGSYLRLAVFAAFGTQPPEQCCREAPGQWCREMNFQSYQAKFIAKTTGKALVATASSLSSC